MSEAKIEIKIGQIQFSGEGDQEWVAKQLDKILTQAERLVRLAQEKVEEEPGLEPHLTEEKKIAEKPLATFLKEKNAMTSEIRKILATAIWLHAKGKERFKTVDLTKALRDAKLKLPGNPTQCLNQNVSKGYCEKVGKEFYVTGEGKSSL